MARELKLPAWAKVVPSALVDKGKVGVVIEVDPDTAYPEWLKALASEDYPEVGGVKRLDSPTNVDQYWLEVCYQCVKLDLQAAIAGTKYDVRTSNKPAEFHFKNSPKFALKEHKPGRGPVAATQGKEARQHYKRVRGSLPF